MIDELLDERQLRKLLGGISRATLYRGMEKRRYPYPIKVAQGRNRWSLASIRAHYIEKLRSTSGLLKALQKADGTWHHISPVDKLFDEAKQLNAMIHYLDNCYVPPRRSPLPKPDAEKFYRALVDSASRH